MNPSYDSRTVDTKIEIEDYLKSFPGIQDYYLTFSRKLNNFSRDKFVIRLWIKEDQYNVHNITNVLAGDGDFKDNLKKIVSKINATVVLDIYNI